MSLDLFENEKEYFKIYTEICETTFEKCFQEEVNFLDGSDHIDFKSQVTMLFSDFKADKNPIEMLWFHVIANQFAKLHEISDTIWSQEEQIFYLYNLGFLPRQNSLKKQEDEIDDELFETFDENIDFDELCNDINPEQMETQIEIQPEKKKIYTVFEILKEMQIENLEDVFANSESIAMLAYTARFKKSPKRRDLLSSSLVDQNEIQTAFRLRFVLYAYERNEQNLKLIKSSISRALVLIAQKRQLSNENFLVSKNCSKIPKKQNSPPQHLQEFVQKQGTEFQQNQQQVPEIIIQEQKKRKIEFSPNVTEIKNYSNDYNGLGSSLLDKMKKPNDNSENRVFWWQILESYDVKSILEKKNEPNVDEVVRQLGFDCGSNFCKNFNPPPKTEKGRIYTQDNLDEMKTCAREVLSKYGLI